MMTRQRLEGGSYKAGGVKGSWQEKKLRESMEQILPWRLRESMVPSIA